MKSKLLSCLPQENLLNYSSHSNHLSYEESLDGKLPQNLWIILQIQSLKYWEIRIKLGHCHLQLSTIGLNYQCEKVTRFLEYSLITNQFQTLCQIKDQNLVSCYCQIWVYLRDRLHFNKLLFMKPISK